MVMKKNVSLDQLKIDFTSINGEYAQPIVKVLQHNHTLQWLKLGYHYPKDVQERIKLSVKEVNKKRKRKVHDCQLNLRVSFTLEHLEIIDYEYEVAI